MALKGAAEARARARSIKGIFKYVAQDWVDAASPAARTIYPRRTGALAASVRKKNVSQKKASIQGNYYGAILSTGAKAHTIEAGKTATKTRKGAKVLKFNKGGQTFFRRKVHHRGLPKRGYRQQVEQTAIKRVPLAKRLFDLWNRAG
jgi:hypothetical protein